MKKFSIIIIYEKKIEARDITEKTRLQNQTNHYSQSQHFFILAFFFQFLKCGLK